MRTIAFCEDKKKHSDKIESQPRRAFFSLIFFFDFFLSRYVLNLQPFHVGIIPRMSRVKILWPLATRNFSRKFHRNSMEFPWKFHTMSTLPPRAPALPRHQPPTLGSTKWPDKGRVAVKVDRVVGGQNASSNLLAENHEAVGHHRRSLSSGNHTHSPWGEVWSTFNGRNMPFNILAPPPPSPTHPPAPFGVHVIRYISV